MKKQIIILLAVLIVLASCDLFQGAVGATGAVGTTGGEGADGRYIVGGYFSCSLVAVVASSIGAAPTADATLFIAFDPDHLLGSGNETVLSVALGTYRDGFDDIYYYGTWSDSSVPSGDYFVYAWYSPDTDSTFDGTMNSQFYYLYTENANGAVPECSLDAGNGEILPGANGILAPNFTVGDEYTPNLDITLDANFS